MKTKSFFSKSILLLVVILAMSCNKDDSPARGNTVSREIKYEITGTYSGHLDVLITDQNGNNLTEVVTALPWSKTITYPANILTIGGTANSVVANAGVAGQTGSLKIYSGDAVKRTSNKTVGQNGLLIFDIQTYSFD